VSEQQIKVGDRVQWTHVSQRGRSVSMRLRQGEVVQINLGGYAEVLVSGGRRVQVLARRLRLMDMPTQIGEFVEGLREEYRRKRGEG
jgi:hypothetical protein